MYIKYNAIKIYFWLCTENCKLEDCQMYSIWICYKVLCYSVLYNIAINSHSPFRNTCNIKRFFSVQNQLLKNLCTCFALYRNNNLRKKWLLIFLEWTIVNWSKKNVFLCKLFLAEIIFVKYVAHDITCTFVL